MPVSSASSRAAQSPGSSDRAPSGCVLARNLDKFCGDPGHLNGQTLPAVHGGQPPDAHFAPGWIVGDFPESPFGRFGDNRAREVFPDP
jgi:hypothetical protein